MLPVIVVTTLCLAGTQDPESRRLPEGRFRSELQRRGLIDLLDQHLRTQPGDDEVATALLQRELRLQHYGDAARPVAERLDAARQATEVLRHLIRSHPGDERVLEWRLDLARDLIDRHAEPFYNNLLFRRGSAEDFRQLAEITSEAVQVYEELIGEIEQRLAEVDRLSVPEFERRARSGEFDKLEGLLPRARYASMWAAYYQCLALPEGAPARRERLERIISYLSGQAHLIDTPHSVSHYQAQSLLLAGMAHRLSGRLQQADAMLSDASRIAAGCPDELERSQLRWVVTLAALERTRSLRDAGQYDQALEVLARHRQRLIEEGNREFGIQLAVALLEGTVHTAAAQRLAPAQSRRRDELTLAARQPLLDLLHDHPDLRSEVYRLFFEQWSEAGDPRTQDPFEKSIYVARMLEQAAETRAQLRRVEQAGQEDDEYRRLQARQRQILASAVTAARALLDDDSPLALRLRPEAHFNLAVCYYEQGRLREAVEELNGLVSDHADFERAPLAADHAVRLAEQLYGRAPAAQREAVRPLLLGALRNLVGCFPKNQGTGDHRFAYATVLQEDRRYDEAAVQYARIPPAHPRRAAAMLRAAHCRLQLLSAAAAGQGGGDAAVLARETIADVNEFRAAAEGSAVAPSDFGSAQLMECEAQLLDPLSEPSKALAGLDEFDRQFSSEHELAGRAIRLRMLAYQAAGQWDRATAIIPAYVRSDPQAAGATLQSLLAALNDDLDRLETTGRSELVGPKADHALTVARELDRWADTITPGLSPEARLSVRLSLGEALLRTANSAQVSEALALFENSARSAFGERDTRVLWGHGEALFQMEEYERALVHFSQLYRALPEDSAWWWKTLHRDLLCRQRLDQDPQMLYNLIEQKRTLFPHLGGSVLKRSFQKLQAELREAARIRAPGS